MKVKNREQDSHFNRIKKSTNIYFNIFFILLAVTCILPIVFIFSISITDEQSIQQYGYQIIPKHLSNAAYMFLWNEKNVIFRATFISIFVTVAGTLISVILTTLMGYVLSRNTYKLKGFLTWVVFIPMIFNGGMLSGYVVNANILHLRDTVWALILPLAVSSFNVVICKTFFRTTIPDSLIESAKIDGARQLTIFSKIVLPLSKPIIATISLFGAFGYWNDWFQSSLYITNKNLQSLQALLNSIQKDIDYLANNPYGGLSLQMYKLSMPTESVRMAIAIVIIIPIAMIYPFFQRYFISGLTIGAVKG
jgi:putative aldouronate transport system permease protein